MSKDMSRVLALQDFTGESKQWCLQVLKKKDREDEQAEMLELLNSLDLEANTHKILKYLIQEVLK
jgi:hypothetical protein